MDRWYLNYKKNPTFFWGWLLILIFFGLFGFWCPLLYRLVSERELQIGTTILEGSLSTFAMVILLEGVHTDRGLPKEQRANYLISSIAWCLIIFHTLIYSYTIGGIKTLTIKWIVLVISMLSVILAVLLYQYKNIEVEESAETIVERERNEIENAANAEAPLNPII